MFKCIAAGVIIIAACLAGEGADPAPKALDYYAGLMEYYAGYSVEIGPKEWEETYLVMYPDKYARNEKDGRKKQRDIEDVRLKLKTVIPAVQKGAHAYTIYLQGELGAYNSVKERFACVFVSQYGFLDLAPPVRDTVGAQGESAGQSVVARGVLFGKISRIKLYFINANEYNTFPCPSAAAAAFLKSRTDVRGVVRKDVYAALTIEIIPREECLDVWQGLTQNVYMPGMGNNYFMIARINHAEIYEDAGMQKKIGSIGSTHPALRIK